MLFYIGSLAGSELHFALYPGSYSAVLSGVRLYLGGGGSPEAERYYAEAISLPLYFGLTESAQDRVVAVLWEVLW